MVYTPIVETRGLCVSIGNNQILKNIDFRVYPGEVVGLLGDNAAGKSTLVNTIMGLYPDYTGEIYIGGRLSSKADVKQRRDLGIEAVYQDYAIVRQMRVWQNFFLGRELTYEQVPMAPLKRSLMRRITREALGANGFDIPAPENLPLSRLSAGQRQLLAIIRAYYFCTHLLILDEPTAALGELEIGQVLRLMEEAKERGIGVILVTHKEHDVFDSIDRFYVIKHGREDTKTTTKSVLLGTADSLLVSSRVLAVRDIVREIASQFNRPLEDMHAELQHIRGQLCADTGRPIFGELLDTIAAEIADLRAIVYHFTSLADRPVVQRKWVAVSDMVDAVIAAVPPAMKTGVDFKVSVSPDLSCRCDPSIVRQVLLNIVVNAIEASSPPASIALWADETGGNFETSVRIGIRDWGKGMDAHLLQHMFNPFFTTKASNSGLGLSIVHKLLEYEQGKIECTSRPGKGSAFVVTLNQGSSPSGSKPGG